MVGVNPLDASVLVLNRMYMPVHVISARRAFCLLCKEAAEVINIEDGTWMAYSFDLWLDVCELERSAKNGAMRDDWVQTVNFAVRVPRILRLLNYDRVPRNIIKFSRRNVFLRDDYCCQYCGRRLSVSGLSLDHVVPRSKGGETSWKNIVTACLKCNVRKGGRTPREANMKLLCEPVRPRNNPALAHQLNSDKYECWKSFVN